MGKKYDMTSFDRNNLRGSTKLIREHNHKRRTKAGRDEDPGLRVGTGGGGGGAPNKTQKS